MIERTPDQHLREISEILIRRGEDADELGVWLSVFPSLSDEEKERLLKLLNEELEKLRGVK